MENKKEEIEWYDNPNFITTLGIIVLVLIIVLSQSFAVKNNLGTNDILRSLLNHNSIYLLGLAYFIPLKTASGKKYFNYLNVFLIVVYAIFTTTSILTIIQSFGLTSLVSLGINIVFLVYMIHSLLMNTRIWKEFKLEKSPFNDLSNDNYFYTIIVLAIILLTVNLIEASTFDGVVIAILASAYTCLLSRFIYLYKKHVELKKSKKEKTKEAK